MNLVESLRVALRSLAANKLRTALTMLGMIIGVGAVIALMSVGKGAQEMVTSRIQGMGTNLLFVTPGNQNQGGIRMGQGTAPTLTLEDADAIADPLNVPAAAAVAPEAQSFAQVIAGPQNTFTRVIGTTPPFEDVRNFHVATGDFISKQNLDARSTVAVLGSNVAQTLFGDMDPIGQNIRIGIATFRVIGVMETKGSQAMGNQDDVVIVPITTLLQRLSNQRAVRGGRNVNTIYVQVADNKLMDAAVQQIGDLLRQRHRTAQDDFTIRSQDDLLSTANQITGVMTLLLGAIAGISLVVGGIGIMNIMLVSVTERTREIGIRKAVGAKRRDVLVQFMIEAVVVSVVGGIVGILLGTGLSALISRINMGGQAINTVVSGDAVALAVGVSAAIGIFFGIYPATKAASLNPIEALRYE
ncbi:MAG: ABC transporter permease [Chloroflexi bacterium]|nr:ABC transporter permease [Chloroflexota bacterium]MDA8188014.1 ABC transporter permease [Dehalococcoidales bacterium]